MQEPGGWTALAQDRDGTPWHGGWLSPFALHSKQKEGKGKVVRKGLEPSKALQRWGEPSLEAQASSAKAAPDLLLGDQALSFLTRQGQDVH